MIIKEISNITGYKDNSIRSILRKNNIQWKNEPHIMQKLTPSSNYIGQKFGALLILNVIRIESIDYFECKCDCGNNYTGIRHSIISGVTKSCGCRISTRKYGNPSIHSAMKIWNKSYKDGDITLNMFIILSQCNCHYCESPPGNCYNSFIMQQKYRKSKMLSSKNSNEFSIKNGNFIYNGLDRIDSSKPHNLDNIVPCCIKCNQSKMDRTYREFFIHIKKMAIKILKPGINIDCFLEEEIIPGDQYIKLVESILSTNLSLEDLITRTGFNKMEDNLI